LAKAIPSIKDISIVNRDPVTARLIERIATAMKARYSYRHFLKTA